jgi:hypothetical protein
LTIEIIASWACGWEHVSATLRDDGTMCLPDWDVMCWVKDFFWNNDECVVQYHPPSDLYVNVHPMVLHLWKPIGVKLPTPPIELV